MNRLASLVRVPLALAACLCALSCGSSPRAPEGTLRQVQEGRRVRVRLREDGDVLTGKAFVVPHDDNGMLDKIKQATDLANSLDWRLHDINVVPVNSIE